MLRLLSDSKECTKCSIVKPISEFFRDSQKSDGHYSSCKTCCKSPSKIRSARWRKNQPDKWRSVFRSSALKRRYGITIEEFESLWDKQQGLCAICHNPAAGKGSMSILGVDHDHKTGKVRGLLCWRCNQGLGYFKDDIKRLQSAIQYLMGFESNLPKYH